MVVVFEGLEEIIASNALLCDSDVEDGPSNDSEKDGTVERTENTFCFAGCESKTRVGCPWRSSASMSSASGEV